MKRGVPFLVSIAALASIVPSAAFAHIGQVSEAGFLHGFLHPLGGIDHLLAVLAVGLWAAQLGGRALWAVPGAFAAAVTAGFCGAKWIALPLAEPGIVASVIGLGLLIAARPRLRVALCAGLAGLFAMFHGYIHGAEMPIAADSISYGAGLLMSTALLSGTGIAATRLLGRALSNAALHALAIRGAGVVIGVGGLGLLAT